MTSARVWLVGIAVALVSAAGPVQAAPGFWQATPKREGMTQYSCGDGCAQTQLICVNNLVPNQEPVPLEEMANEAIVPWGQMDFSLLTQISRDREGLAGADKFVDGKRVSGPAIVSFGGADWVLVQYQMQTKKGGLAAELLLWPDPKGVATLQCSYSAGVDDDGSVAVIRQLAESLRLIP